MSSNTLNEMNTHLSLYVNGASLSLKKAVALRSFFATSLPGQQHEHSQLLPGGQHLPAN